ncbi:DDB1- and CUL4-associated factor 8 isoform X2 [Canna indica]|uniref:DDB1- and CUL4-associated factor 8 isoform X2 n=1 Tax=Canna indica TaxID=4628 RepID=A0AAQ3KJE9_9LILI|nr:DDB1- and CUL4-associated factor 8 isoform X2 [Canna indica]
MKRWSTRGRGPGVVELCQRELGGFSPRAFAHRFGASEDLVMRFGIDRKLENHRGCVNTVSFNADGDILTSGSDDRKVILWDWASGNIKLSFYSGHSNNVFQARFMPYTDDQTMVTCAADGEVRQAQILQGGNVATTLLTKHGGRAHKLGVEPGCPHIFYSCGEDGLVHHIDLRTKTATKLFTCKLDDGAVVGLNAIAIDPRSPNVFAIAGLDKYARVYDMRKYKWNGSSDRSHPTDYFCPQHLIDDNYVGITGLAFSDQSELLASYSDEFIYLFSKDQGLGPNRDREFPKSSINADAGDGSTSTSPPSPLGEDQIGPRVYKGHCNSDTVKGVSFFGPNCEYVTSGSDCGRVFIWRKKDGKLLRAMEGDTSVVNCIEPHPYATVIATSGIDKDVKIWTPNAVEPVPPIKLEELKPHKRTNVLRFALPEDIIAQMLALQRMQTWSADNDDEDLADSVDLVDLVNSFNRESSSDGNGDTSDGPGECKVN